MAAPFACFASGSTVAAWVRNGTRDTVVTQPGSPLGAMVVAGLRTGYDVACNGPDATDRLPGGVSDAGLASVALGPEGGALVLANGSVVAVGRSDGVGYFPAQAQGTGLPPTARFTVASCADVDGDGAVDVVLGAAPGSASAGLLGTEGAGLVASPGLGTALTAAFGTQGLLASVVATLGPACPAGVSVVAATPGGLQLALLASNGTAAVVSTSSVAAPSGVVGIVVVDVDRDGMLDAVGCGASTSTLLLAPGLCQAGARFDTVATLPGPCSGLGAADANGDGWADLFVSGAPGVNNSLWLGDGSGHFTAAGTGAGLGVGPVAPVFHDVNRCVILSRHAIALCCRHVVPGFLGTINQLFIEVWASYMLS